jgi:hypothetical protein
MIIDGDVHLSSLIGDNRISADQALRRMDRAGVDKALTWIQPSYIPMVKEQNAYIYEPTKRYPDRFLGFGWANPHLGLDDAKDEIDIMYYHGPVEQRRHADAGQCSFAATSKDGLHFCSGDEILGTSYFRVFRWGGYTYALSMPGIMNRSHNGFTDFQRGPTLYSKDMRHTALKPSSFTPVHVPSPRFPRKETP